MRPETHAAGWDHSETVDRPRTVDRDEAFGAVHTVLGRKWHLRIIYHLLTDGSMGFSRLKESIEGVSPKMLSESLSTLETQALVDRDIVNEQPARVEYSLTDSGRALEPAVESLLRWAATDGIPRGEA